MMGLHATTTAVAVGKRKFESTAPTDLDAPPAKNGKWDPPATGVAAAASATDDCIARLRAVAVPAADAWRAPTPSLAATLLSEDEFDDDEFEDELSDDERCAAAMVPPFDPPRFATPAPQISYGRYQSNDHWQYYQPPQQQTIRCEENGKSYLELGAAPQTKTRVRCCDGRTRWCHVPCYRQRRLAVLNLSMCKLARYRQCSDPSLRRSVLICNTLRRLEREMEADPPEPSYPMLPEMTPPTRPCPVPEAGYEQSLREVACPSGRATPFPTAAPDTDSGLGDDEDDARPINWGSVLSLASQTDLVSLNNNELYAELGLSAMEDDGWREPSSRNDPGTEWDGLMHVLVGGT
ncbi:SERTA domain-containing protein 2 taranis isoform X2 [Rhynchophorus ferrugineus]